jgi:hypothetical protein
MKAQGDCAFLSMLRQLCLHKSKNGRCNGTRVCFSFFCLLPMRFSLVFSHPSLLFFAIFFDG